MNRSIIFALLILTFAGLQSCAQNVPSSEPTTTRRGQRANITPEQRADRQTQQMKQRLSLTADQEASVAAINLNYARQGQSLIMGGGRNKTTLKQLRSLMNSKDDELKKVFDKDQYNQYQAFVDERRNQMKQARGRRGNR